MCRGGRNEGENRSGERMSSLILEVGSGLGEWGGAEGGGGVAVGEGGKVYREKAVGVGALEGKSYDVVNDVVWD